jgi:hypothetical protein
MIHPTFLSSFSTGDSIVMVADDDSCLDPDFELLEITAAKVKGQTLHAFRKSRQDLTSNSETMSKTTLVNLRKDKRGSTHPSVLLSKGIAVVARQLRQSSQYGLRTVYEIVSPTPSQHSMQRISYRDASTPSFLKTGPVLQARKNVPISRNRSASQEDVRSSQSSFSTQIQRTGYGFFMTLDWMRAVDHASCSPKREASIGVADKTGSLEADLLALERSGNNGIGINSNWEEGGAASSRTPWWQRWSGSVKDIAEGAARSNSSRLAHGSSLESAPGTSSSGGLLSRADKECSSPEDERVEGAGELLGSEGQELPWWDRVLGSKGGHQDFQVDMEESNKPWWDRVLPGDLPTGGELTYEAKRRLHASKMQLTRQPSKPSMTTSIRSHESKQHFHGRFLICGWRRNMVSTYGTMVYGMNHSMILSEMSHESKKHFYGNFLICGWQRKIVSS